MIILWISRKINNEKEKEKVNDPQVKVYKNWETKNTPRDVFECLLSPALIFRTRFYAYEKQNVVVQQIEWLPLRNVHFVATPF